MITAILPYTGNKIGFVQLLVSLQPQLHPDDDIYVIDSTKEHSSLSLVKAYGSSRCYIFVELSDKTGPDAVSLGLQSMKENKQEGAVVLFENNIISNTFIVSLKRAMTHKDWEALVPRTSVEIDGMIDPNFSWFCPITHEVKMVEDYWDIEPETPCFCRASVVNNKYQAIIDTKKCGRFENELVVITQSL